MAKVDSQQEARLRQQRDYFGSLAPTQMIDIKKGETLPGLSVDGKATIAEQDTKVKAFDLAEGLNKELDALSKRMKERQDSALSSREQTGGSALVGSNVSTIPSLTSVLV